MFWGKKRREREKEEMAAADRRRQEFESTLNEEVETAGKALPSGSIVEWVGIRYTVLEVGVLWENYWTFAPSFGSVYADLAYRKSDGSRAIEKFSGNELKLIVKQQQEAE